MKDKKNKDSVDSNSSKSNAVSKKSSKPNKAQDAKKSNPKANSSAKRSRSKGKSEKPEIDAVKIKDPNKAKKTEAELEQEFLDAVLASSRKKEEPKAENTDTEIKDQFEGASAAASLNPLPDFGSEPNPDNDINVSSENANTEKDNSVSDQKSDSFEEEEAVFEDEELNAEDDFDSFFDDDLMDKVVSEPEKDTEESESKENSEAEEESEEKSEVEKIQDSVTGFDGLNLLNIEHFSDYRSKSESDGQSEEKTQQQEEDNQKTEFVPDSFEDLTILGKEEVSEPTPTIKPPKYEDPDRERYNPEKPRKIDNRFDFLELFIFTLAAVMIITTFFFRHSIVEGSSMENTLHEGEHLIISDLFYTPEHGDIIVCQDHATGLSEPIVKRVIALAGDTIEILPDGTVLLNDEPIPEESDYVHCDAVDMYPGHLKVTVPEGYMYVMGDHRNLSKDSREFGFVREDAVLGKVLLRFYPFDKFGTVN